MYMQSSFVFYKLTQVIVAGSFSWIKPHSSKLNNLVCHQLEVVSRYRDPQPQVVENFWYLQIFMLKQSFRSQ